MIVACVLRSGGEYLPEHVERLRDGVLSHLPGAEFRCLSDVEAPGRIPLEHGWPGWWAKMSLFSPSLTGDFLYLDLDTIITGDLSDIASVNRLTLMRDVYRPDGLQSSIMFLPQSVRAPVWGDWISDPARWMQRYRRGGDQAFLERHWLRKAARFQDVLPGQVVSFKVHCGDGVPDDARAVIFHGKPRPWDTDLYEAFRATRVGNPSQTSG